jgi:MFS transporter, MHS family, proline/betaine transporter
MTRSSRMQLWSACLGNLFEHYDTALFGFLSPFLAPLLFPHQEPLMALILTYAIIPLGMLARPLGSIVFGHIGDVYGRKHALFLTLVGMAFVSGGIAFIPTYLQVGLLAPLLFFLGRALQNFLSGGETMGGAIFLLENTSEKRHDLLSGLYNASTMGGHLLASFGVYLLSRYALIDPGWRLLYLFGCITALFGCMIRRQVDFPKDKNSVKFSQTLSKLGSIFWTYRKPFSLIAITSGFAAANYSIALVLMNGFIPLVSSFTKTEIMEINSYLLIFDFLALPFFGWLASKVSREKLMLSASLGVVVLAIPLFTLLEGASLISVIGIRTYFVISGVAFFAPFHAWAQQLVPPAYRYAVISFGYAIGSQVIGSPTAAISLWCFKTTGIASSVSWYWVVLAIASSMAVAITLKAIPNETQKLDLG